MKNLLKKITIDNIAECELPSQYDGIESKKNNIISIERTLHLITKDNIRVRLEFDTNDITILDLEDVRNFIIPNGQDKERIYLNLLCILLTLMSCGNYEFTNHNNISTEIDYTANIL